MVQTSLEATATPLLEANHRQFLTPHSCEDSNTDPDSLSDDPSSSSRLDADFHSGDGDVIGVSISRAQTRMKSATTPAAEKARVLDESVDYFGIDQILHERDSEELYEIAKPEILDEDGLVQTTSPEQIASRSEKESPLPKEQQSELTKGRSSLTRSLLGSAGSHGRPRSSSGSSILGALRKFIPGHDHDPQIEQKPSPLAQEPAAESPKPAQWTNSRPFEGVADDAASNGTSDLTRLETQKSPFSTGLDGNLESVVSPMSLAKTKSRPRSNSEGSLYLKKRATGMSAFDDTSAYADVADMANSRFKAITDSLQGSTIRLPKLPSIINPTKHLSIHSSNSDSITRDNTEANAGSRPSPSQYQYTSVKEIRNNQKNDAAADHPKHRAHPVLHEALAKLNGDVVVLGGYRGSILRSAKPPHRQVWVPVKVGLNLRKVNLEVGLTREDEMKMEEDIIPSGVLSHIGPIDICRRLLRHLRRCPHTRENNLRVHDWGYDWRLSPELLSQKLINFLETLECNHSETPAEHRGATVIAHSLGGLITRHAVNKRPELFAGVLYAGVPQSCVNILGPLRNGDDVLLSSRVLTAQVNFTLRTSFALLPEDGRCFIQKHTNERYDVDFFDLKSWKDNCLSPCICPAVIPPHKEVEHRKSIIGAISSSIAPRRSSWFGSAKEEPSSGEDSRPPSSAKENAKDVAKSAVNGADQLRQNLTSPEGSAEHNFQPTMRQSNHKPSIATAVTIPVSQAEQYLERTLKEVYTFKQELAFNPSHQQKNLYPPHAFIFGKTVPTVFGARVASREAIKYSDAFDDLAFAAGDGVVLASAAQLPDGYRCVKGGRVESDRGHVGLLGDLESVGKCLNALIDARHKGVGMGEEHKHGHVHHS